jgi:hypothetical protein
LELIHRVLRYPCGAILHSVTLLIANNVSVYSQRNSRITVPQLPLHHSRGCAVCEQGTGRTVPHRMKPAAWNTQLHQQRMKLFFAQLVC